ncbi:Proline--tRNA ligase [Candidatus Magnetaquicoccaceae bacterium FCR-1]|uniref:Proline--tRNA ligase n=1 Tax=Candidatus Magnetaquiglobus chichijimensis TaxID=3141448 RepID=A0ABQ0C8T3_9PROT
MRFSVALIPTLKEAPVEAHTVSHRLMLRAGLIRPLGSGIYTWLPVGLKILRKVEAIVRQEMDAAGAQEVLMPAVQPAELWRESGRWDFYGKELLRILDRHEREFCFGPTHEEVITDLARRELKSYRQLPVNFYQIQTKFRDEIRPRFGIMRGREFLMKDAYSFDMDATGLDVTYRAMHAAYTRIFQRCGLGFRPVEADTGSIGGSSSHEFHVLASSGEDVIASCTRCDYAANLEKATSAPLSASATPDDEPMRLVATPGKKSIPEVSAFLNLPESRLVKCLVVEAGGRPHLLLLRGDHELNLVKAANALGVDAVQVPEPGRIAELTGGLPVGYMGPVGTTLPILADRATESLVSFACGANQTDHHLTGVVWERDLPRPACADLRNVQPDDPCPRCAEGHLRLDRGIEVGHIFKLGEKYSKALNVTVLDPEGKERTPIMGCYGIGVSRIVAAAIEQNHDDNGIIWPVALAPFEVEILLANPNDALSVQTAESLYAGLTAMGIGVLLDDRDDRLGVKFKDADLIGCPLRVMAGGRALKEGKVEIQIRKGGDPLQVPVAEALATLRDLLGKLAGEESNGVGSWTQN